MAHIGAFVLGINMLEDYPAKAGNPIRRAAWALKFNFASRLSYLRQIARPVELVIALACPPFELLLAKTIVRRLLGLSRL